MLYLLIWFVYLEFDKKSSAGFSILYSLFLALQDFQMETTNNKYEESNLCVCLIALMYRPTV